MTSVPYYNPAPAGSGFGNEKAENEVEKAESGTQGSGDLLPDPDAGLTDEERAKEVCVSLCNSFSWTLNFRLEAETNIYGIFRTRG